MDQKNLISLVIGATVVIILVGAFMAPIFQATVETTGTITNDGLYNMSEYETTETFSATWDHSSPKQITVNGSVEQLPTTAGAFAYTIIGGPDFMARLLIEGSSTYFQIWIGSATTVYEAKTSGGGSDMAITLTDGVMTFDNGSGTTKTAELTESFYCVTDGGEFVMKNYDETAYVLEDSELVAIGNSGLQTTGSVVGERFVIVGTIEDGFTAEYYPLEVSIGDISATYVESENDDYVGLLDFSSLGFTATYDSTETDVTYSQMLVPSEVTAEKSQHLSTGEIALVLAIIPVVLAALIGIVAFRIRD